MLAKLSQEHLKKVACENVAGTKKNIACENVAGVEKTIACEIVARA
jgi:hypothetical protein